jgi:DNA repair exonuclease SbcCD ATPase subunit
MLRKYSDKLKDDLAAYAAEKEEAVKSYGLSLDVEQQAARELMKRLLLSDQELSAKAATLATIDERISQYDHSLEELVNMTARVQENLDRLREESQFVEGTFSQVKGLREKLGTLEKDLGKIEQRFQRENAEALEQTREDFAASFKSTLQDLETQAEIIERKVEDHREAVDRIEAEREERLQEGEAFIKNTLARSLEEAGRQADTLEDAALAKLQEQAQDRVEKLKLSLEEKIKTYQESAKTRTLELQDLLKQQRAGVKAAAAEFAAAAKEQEQQRQAEEAALAAAARSRQEDLKQRIAEGEAALEQFNAGLSLQLGRFDTGLEDLNRRWTAVSGDLETSLVEQEQKWLQASQDMDGATTRQWERWETLALGLERSLETQRKNWDDAAAAFETALAAHNSQVEAALAAGRDRMDTALLSRTEDVENTLKALEQRSITALAAHNSQVEAALAAGREQVDAALLSRTEDVANTLKALEQRSTAALAAHNSQVEAALAAGREQVDAALLSRTEDMESVLKALEQRSAAALAAHSGRVEAALAAGQDRVDAALSARKKDVEQALRNMEEQSGALIKARGAQLDSELEAHGQKMETLAAEVRTGLEERRREIAVLAAENQSLWETRRQDWTDQAAHYQDTLRNQLENWRKVTEESYRQALEESDQTLETYKTAQAGEFQRLGSIADDAARLEGELRRIMEAAEAKVRDSFIHFEEESAVFRRSAVSGFDAQVDNFNTILEGLKQELTELKKTSSGVVSENLKDFEDQFSVDLSRRKADIDHRFDSWLESVEQRLNTLTEQSLEQRKGMETVLSEKSREDFAVLEEKLDSGLEQLRRKVLVMEAEIRKEIQTADETRLSFRDQLNRDMEDLRLAAESSIKVEIGRYTLSAQESIKQNQRDLEGRLKEAADSLETRNGELRSSQERIRELAEENDSRIAQFRSSLDKAREEAVVQRQEIFARTQEEARVLSASVEEAEQRIRDFTAQTALFDRAGELKTELEHRIEDLRSDIDRLDQRKSEVAQMEGEFVRIRRLGDEVGAKMNRFLLEQRRIDTMEENFDRFLRISQAVDVKLAQVSDTHDTLEAVQVQIRHLEDALQEVEERYQRVERKNEALEETSNGISRNFKALQDSETALDHLRQEQDDMASRFGKLRDSIETLAGESEKAQAVSGKLTLLDESLSAIETRIKDVQKAREWLAALETRMEEMYHQTQDHVKLAGDIIKGGQTLPDDKSALTPAVRENVLRLARRGWSVKQISNSIKLSEGAVELILEFATRD